MRLQRVAVSVAATILLFVCPQGPNAKTASGDEKYLGRWDLTLKAADREYPSWLELSEKDGKLQARMVARWGHARALPKAELADGKLTFVSPKEEEGSDHDLVFEGKLNGETLSGT